jgi:hypothetical protein
MNLNQTTTAGQLALKVSGTAVLPISASPCPRGCTRTLYTCIYQCGLFPSPKRNYIQMLLRHTVLHNFNSNGMDGEGCIAGVVLANN